MFPVTPHIYRYSSDHVERPGDGFISAQDSAQRFWHVIGKQYDAMPLHFQ